MIRRNARLRREYMYRKSLEGKDKLLYERKRLIKKSLEGMISLYDAPGNREHTYAHTYTHINKYTHTSIRVLEWYLHSCSDFQMAPQSLLNFVGKIKSFEMNLLMMMNKLKVWLLATVCVAHLKHILKVLCVHRAKVIDWWWVCIRRYQGSQDPRDHISRPQ